ncbi:DUF488 domain-containing protein [Jeotgalibaca sp. MA1X17-3]|uniref:DUF488 domain-containing protein n=1 Tax=Jeotgalibaca sp. MA1X17-3 TaxID=2908211 RepID=UPI001F2DE7B2|nr:DUF488 domain-containing protein [Jeotgalibaca sp. MA1X17-3]UJF15998.1 DUF488 domain-containing protein [Jeotgalibaca sp. MA1X17-3]
MNIYTIGHSTHSEEEFISLLQSYDIEALVDVRSYPGSNYMPQFNKENMEKWIPENGIQYIHMPSLGGRRKKNHDIDESLVDGWRNNSFQNYAAYSLTKEYEEALHELVALEKDKRVCYMCSESVPWRCHRLIISNNLALKGLTVHHIMTEKKTIPHEIGLYGAKAVVEGSKIIYPKEAQIDEKEK